MTHSYLKEAQRPKGILALWRDNALAVGQAAEAQGLVLGTDLDLVGWCPEEMFDTHYAAICPSLAKKSATVMWRISDVVNLAFDVLERRHRTPQRNPVRERVSMQIQNPSPSYSHPKALSGNILV